MALKHSSGLSIFKFQSPISLLSTCQFYFLLYYLIVWVKGNFLQQIKSTFGKQKRLHAIYHLQGARLAFDFKCSGKHVPVTSYFTTERQRVVVCMRKVLNVLACLHHSDCLANPRFKKCCFDCENVYSCLVWSCRLRFGMYFSL